MKKYLVFIFCLGLSMTAGAQQITRFAVVDLSRIYMSFFMESRAVRDFEDQSARVQAEIDRMSADIQNLRVNLINAQSQGLQEQALRLETEINRRNEFLKEYYRTKTAELEMIRSRLAQSEAFVEQVYDEIRYIAESEGYSMVLNINNNTGILWYSPTVDITDKVIRSLRDKSRR